MPFQSGDRPPQGPVGRGQKEKIVHVTDIANPGLRCQIAVDRVEMKGGQQRAEGSAPADAAFGGMEISAVLHAVVQKLPQQVPEYRVGDMPGQLGVETLFVDGGVIPLDVGAKDKPCPGVAQVMMHALRASPAAAMPPDMLAQRMNRKQGCQGGGQHPERQGVP
ncbi:Uncharacterised protein [Serratia marcescens]|nr:Uncharacterised protein [Serratia marcescens]